jgi:3-dehydroquinate dehydratase-2
VNILILNGPNLNLLGTREPDVYGSETLSDVMQACVALGNELNCSVEHFQSNHEGQLIDVLHEASGKYDAIIINPAAFTHTSVALRDALLGVAIPFIEVHISNVHARETFRHHSYFSDIAQSVIVGCGTYGYQLAVMSAVQNILPN